ncbi:MAG: DUF692 family protein [Anaerolineaceae bacterium]|nr:MAG: DUF692 family protein [Anaerolineaceae bacterium]
MRVSINYSTAAAGLVDSGEIQVDVFKCPAWPDLIDSLAERPVYVHFPLLLGRSAVIDSEAGAPADFDKIERLREQTGTPFVNVHLAPLRTEYPEIPTQSNEPAHIEQIIADATRGIRALQARFGTENVIVENVPASDERLLWAGVMPQTIERVVEQTGAGFLLDISHARLTAERLARDEREYLDSLPVAQIREIHVTGIEFIDESKIAQLEALGIAESFYHRYIGRKVDHLPFNEVDWTETAWAFDQIHAGRWQAPEIVAFEYGGVGGMWEKIADRDIIRQQVPRLYQMVKRAEPVR